MYNVCIIDHNYMYKCHSDIESKTKNKRHFCVTKYF